MINNILVLGATGTQGLPSVRELLKKGFKVRAFTKEGGPKVSILEQLGAEVVYGDLFDEESLYTAMQGMEGLVFIPVIPSASDPIPEITVGANVLKAAEKAGIQYLVHTSVDRAGEHESFEGWGKRLLSSRMYWLAKSTVIDFVKASKIPHWTVLKPVALMDNFTPPTSPAMYALLKDGLITTARLPETKVSFTNGDDLGRAVAEAFFNFDKFDKKEVPLASDSLTMDEVAAVISKVTGKNVKAVFMTREELLANENLEEALQAYFGGRGVETTGILSSLIDSFEWDNINGYTATPEVADAFGIKVSTFEEWCIRHKDEFEIK